MPSISCASVLEREHKHSPNISIIGGLACQVFRVFRVIRAVPRRSGSINLCAHASVESFIRSIVHMTAATTSNHAALRSQEPTVGHGDLGVRGRVIGGVALLLLVSLVMQLPALRVYENVLQSQQGQRSPERLVARPIVLQHMRLAQRQTIKPAAHALMNLRSSAPASDARWAHRGSIRVCTLLGLHYLDLPPPVLG
jgi:hypothetical protein